MKRAITTKWLEEHDACKEEIAVFRKEWGKSAPLTRKNLLRAMQLELNLEWLAAAILAGPVYGTFFATIDKAWKIFRRNPTRQNWETYTAVVVNALWSALKEIDDE